MTIIQNKDNGTDKLDKLVSQDKWQITAGICY
jgi:hypothetical protein